MPADPVPRALHYVGLIFLLSTYSTFPWWLAAQASGTAYRRIWSALACSMRIFAYSISLLVVLVALQSFGIGPDRPGDALFGRIHLLGTVLISVPSAMRAFRLKGPRLALVLLVGWALFAASLAAAALAFQDVAAMLERLPRYLAPR